MKNKLFISFGLIVSLQLCASVYLSSLPYPYNTLSRLLPFNNHGWYHATNAIAIEKLIRYNNVKNVVEVGSWLGLSTRHIASLLPDDGRVYAVDSWLGSIEHHETLEYAKMLPTLYEQFLSNMVHAGYTKKIRPIRATSLEAAEKLHQFYDHFDLIYIDAAHDTESVYKDMEAYFPFVEGNKGILCGDDWWWDGVKVAVLRFALRHQLTVYTHDNFWFLKETGIFRQETFLDATESVWCFNLDK